MIFIIFPFGHCDNFSFGFAPLKEQVSSNQILVLRAKISGNTRGTASCKLTLMFDAGVI